MQTVYQRVAPHGAPTGQRPLRRLLIVSLNFPPELTGIGKYVGEMTQDLADRGLEVRVVAAPPYYPGWSVPRPYRAWSYARERLAGAVVWRCPLYVPSRPTGLKRLAHLVSFAATTLPVILWQAIAWRPHVVFVVEPPLACAPASLLAARIAGATAWLHIQDFEVEAAFGLGLLRAGWLRRLALALERGVMSRFDRVTSISGPMARRIAAKGIPTERIGCFPNWVDTGLIRPDVDCSAFRRELGIPDAARVLLYAGNMGEKQGLELLVELARRLEPEPNLLLMFCGDGAARVRIQSLAGGLSNVRFLPLQPLDRLNALLNLATLHLLPQRVAAEDLVLPSKLTTILASGRPLVACAAAGTELARVASVGGLVVPPGDTEALAAATRRLLEDVSLREHLGAAGRRYALNHLDRRAVLDRLWAALHGTETLQS